MRFLADENFPGAAVAALRRAGVAVDWALELAPGAPDEAVLARALTSGAVILTFDKDFGELAWCMKPNGEFGVLLFRMPMPRAVEAGEAAVCHARGSFVVDCDSGLYSPATSLRRSSLPTGDFGMSPTKT